jgi:autotransporter-associated beta strand protein
LLTGSASTTVNTFATLDFHDSTALEIHNLSGGGAVKTGTVAGGGAPLHLFVNGGATSTFSGTISGTHAVEIENIGFGVGTMIFTGSNTYTGGTTICSCGALQLGDATHAGSIVGAVTNFGTFNIVNADTSAIISITNEVGKTTFSNATSAGTIAITNLHAGKTVFNDTSTAAGATIVNRNNGTTVFNDMSTAGSAGITNRNTGKTDFNNKSSAGAATILNRAGGLTSFANNSTAGSASIANQFFGETDFNNNSTAGSATILNRFGGLTAFSNNSDAGSAAITNRFGGQLFFLNKSSAGSATIVNNSFGGPASFIPEGVFFVDKSTAGNATIINNNQGAIAFGFPFGNDKATAANANITNNAGSSLQFNAFTTAGNATITTNSGAAVGFFDFSTGGNARFITNGTGFVDFGGTIGPNFDGRITAGSIEGSGFYYIGGLNTLVVGGNNLSTEVSGVIADNNPCGCTSGSGSLEKVGSGQLTLSGINTYTGSTTVNGGFLSVMGSIASSSGTTVNSGGALTGSGIVSDTTIASGGIFLPGSGFGTSMSVQGNLAFQSGALYLVQLTSTTSTSADVSGTAQLHGDVAAAFAPGSTVMKQYMILHAAGGVSGTFDGLSVAAPGNFVASLSYDPTHAYINFNLDFSAANHLNVNQTNVGNALTNFFNSNGGISAVFASLSPAGLTQASGELATGTQQATFNAMNLFLSLLTDPFVAGRGSNVAAGGGAQPYAEEESSLAYAAKTSGGARDALARMPTKAVARNDLLDNRWSVWGSAFGGGADISGNAALGSNSANVRAFGFAAGADYRISPATIAGFALAGGGTNFSVTGSGYGRSDMFQAGAFVRHTVGAAYVTGALAYGGQEVTTDRFVTIAGLDHLRAQFNSNAWSGRIEGGYRYATPWMGITPYAAAQFTTIDLPAYAEQVIAGTGMFALNYNARSVTDPRSELGVRTDRSFAMSNGILTLRGRLAWAHDYYTDRNITPVFQALPGAFFVVNGAAQAHDSALTTASAEMRWLNGWSAAATFEGEFSNVMSSYAGKAVVRYAW